MRGRPCRRDRLRSEGRAAARRGELLPSGDDALDEDLRVRVHRARTAAVGRRDMGTTEHGLVQRSRRSRPRIRVPGGVRRRRLVVHASIHAAGGEGAARVLGVSFGVSSRRPRTGGGVRRRMALRAPAGRASYVPERKVRSDSVVRADARLDMWLPMSQLAARASRFTSRSRGPSRRAASGTSAAASTRGSSRRATCRDTRSRRPACRSSTARCLL